LEKQDITGNVSYDPINHQHMVDTRAAKVAGVANDIPLQEVDGPETGDVLILSWGGTYGACATAVAQARRQGGSVSHAHLRYLNPFPRNLGQIVKRFKKVLVPELNKGQLLILVRHHFLVDAIGLNKVQGKPFTVAEVVSKIQELLK
jgi:2-oxoglutarate ferredoxin oxidoreductase subunit alpha